MNDLLNYNIFRGSLNNINLEKHRIINTINPHSYCVAKKDLIFKKALQESDILLPDGIGIVWGIKILENQKIEKIAGFDIFNYLMKYLNKNKGSCFFLGSSKETLSLIEEKTSLDFPNVIVKAFSPPFKKNFSDIENKIMCDKINQSNADILFVGMTAPKQEKWVYENKNKISVKNICTIGAVFNFYAEEQRAPSIMINFGLEWLYRSVTSWRLAKRNIVSNPIFIKDIIVKKFLK